MNHANLERRTVQQLSVTMARLMGKLPNAMFGAISTDDRKGLITIPCIILPMPFNVCVYVAAKALQLMELDKLVEDPFVFIVFQKHSKSSMIVWDAVESAIENEVVYYTQSSHKLMI